MSVRLRPYKETDAASLAAAARESVAEVRPWMPWCHAEFSEPEAHSWIRRKLDDWRLRREYNFCVVDEAGLFLGTCSINQIHASYPLANIGYWVRTGATGRGIATSAVQQVVSFASRATELLRLEILVATGNAASARVAQKAGGQLEGR